MVKGFVTSTWLHECDEMGRVRRHKLSAAPGHAGWSSWGHAVFLPPTDPKHVCSPKEEITLLYAGPDRSFEPMPFFSNGEASPLPKDCAHVAIQRTLDGTDDSKIIPAFLSPKEKAVPVIMIFSDEHGGVVTRAALPITRLLRTQSDFDQELSKIGIGDVAAQREKIQLILERPSIEAGNVLQFQR